MLVADAVSMGSLQLIITVRVVLEVQQGPTPMPAPTPQALQKPIVYMNAGMCLATGAVECSPRPCSLGWILPLRVPGHWAGQAPADAIAAAAMC